MTDVKKRGRKPNGGKIVQQAVDLNGGANVMPNIILHLKCVSNDLYNKSEMYDSYQPSIQYEPVVETIVKPPTYNADVNYDVKANASACFWCTCSYAGNSAHIPKFVVNQVHHVYGCFCSPECATAFLFNENVDSSIKFERYYLLNSIYGTPTSSVKPAPSPFYTLNKFCGRLTIDEYRAQFNQTSKVEVQMKQVSMNVYTNDERNNETVSTESKRVMKKSNKKPNKAAILNNTFASKNILDN
jgi:hypothetical protein